jgi:hypothetical protein
MTHSVEPTECYAIEGANILCTTQTYSHVTLTALGCYKKELKLMSDLKSNLEQQ